MQNQAQILTKVLTRGQLFTNFALKFFAREAVMTHVNCSSRQLHDNDAEEKEKIA